jgi:hypothetical protein
MVLSLRVSIMHRALDPASAVTTHLDAVGPASRQAGSPAMLVLHNDDSAYCACDRFHA